jgi:hypothetical protein
MKPDFQGVRTHWIQGFIAFPARGQPATGFLGEVLREWRGFLALLSASGTCAAGHAAHQVRCYGGRGAAGNAA